MLETTGIAGDRAFAVLDRDDRLVNGKRLGPLATIRPAYDPVACTLALHFPDGAVVAGALELGPVYIAPFRTRPRAVHPVIGPWSEAVSTFARQPCRLVALGDPWRRWGSRADRDARLDRCAGHPGPGRRRGCAARRAAVPDDVRDRRRGRLCGGRLGRPRRPGRRGRRSRRGQRRPVRGHDPGPRHRLPDLRHPAHLEETRGSLETTEPLPFGVWSEVLAPGRVRLGDAVEPVRG